MVNFCDFSEYSKLQNVGKTQQCFRFSFSFFNRTFFRMLLCTFLFCFPLLTSSQQVNNNGNYELQPSKALLPVYDEEYKEEPWPSLNEENFENPDGSSCRFEARSGRLFKYSIPEKIKEFHPRIREEEIQNIKVSSTHISFYLRRSIILDDIFG